MQLVFLFVVENSHRCAQKIKAVAMVPHVLTDAESTSCEKFDDMEMRKYVLITCDAENEYLYENINYFIAHHLTRNLV